MNRRSFIARACSAAAVVVAAVYAPSLSRMHIPRTCVWNPPKNDSPLQTVGEWSSAESWEGRRVPQRGDTVIVRSGVLCNTRTIIPDLEAIIVEPGSGASLIGNGRGFTADRIVVDWNTGGPILCR